ncbi:MAG: endonuclease domain-containing protein [Ferruginibacter sp.]
MDNMFYGAGPIIFELAKKLRNTVTPTEMILWGRLKESFPQLKFRRQHPISLYIADFYCHSERLIIEIDGSIHNLEMIKIKDALRQKDIEDLGIKVLRFTNKQITDLLQEVVIEIKQNLKS